MIHGEAAQRKTIPDTFTVIHNRKSVLYSTGASVTLEQINRLLKTALRLSSRIS
jgi:hypothetical protein